MTQPDFIPPSHEEAVAFAQEQQARIKKSNIRATIKEQVGDDKTLIGTTSDAAALAVYGFASIANALSNAQSLADIRKAVAPFADLSAEFLGKVESGEVLLPFMEKGIANVVLDIEQSATAVSKALKDAS